MAVIICVGYAKDAQGIGQRTVSSFNASSWACLSIASFIVMSSSSRIFNNSLCGNRDTEFCDRTNFAVSLGAVSGFVALIWTSVGSRLPVMLDIILSFGSFAAWCFGVAYITFGDTKSPTQNLGNLYFFTWGCFSLSSSSAASALQASLAMLNIKDDTPEPESAEKEIIENREENEANEP